ncbi:hypothetical protein [Hydrogenophaga sp.]|uniref:hypothetical protein n=1 Tax=Hydrogenophaga sp. TaxID=1904254 RepID=UPI002730BF43|nr:hypothetical protein [Hydrogenophaga sp.]MDP2016311.1 hypothetical protein [Hydrogenophaga sp.]MDP3166522.1 hypothetical protein [Hydrogenophaga sp.]
MGKLPRAGFSAPLGWPVEQCPNFPDWKLGDIVLVHGSRNVVGAALTAGQYTTGAVHGLDLLREYATVTHAGVYVGDGYMVDVTPSRSAEKVSVWTYAQNRKIEVRRVPGDSGEDIAKAAISYLGKPYDLKGLISDGVFPGISSETESLYCSSLVDLAVREGSDRFLGWVDGCQPVYPATLAGHPHLLTVSIYWARTTLRMQAPRARISRKRFSK